MPGRRCALPSGAGWRAPVPVSGLISDLASVSASMEVAAVDPGAGFSRKALRPKWWEPEGPGRRIIRHVKQHVRQQV